MLRSPFDVRDNHCMSRSVLERLHPAPEVGPARADQPVLRDQGVDAEVNFGLIERVGGEEYLIWFWTS